MIRCVRVRMFGERKREEGPKMGDSGIHRHRKVMMVEIVWLWQ